MSALSYWGQFVLAVLATWRITHLLAREDGPADLVVRLRARLGGGFFARLLDCFYCLSLWVAAPLAVLLTRHPVDLLLTWPALSGAACLLERVGQAPVVFQPLPNPSHGESDHGMLRAEAGGVPGDADAGTHSPGPSSLHEPAAGSDSGGADSRTAGPRTRAVQPRAPGSDTGQPRTGGAAR